MGNQAEIGIHTVANAAISCRQNRSIIVVLTNIIYRWGFRFTFDMEPSTINIQRCAQRSKGSKIPRIFYSVLVSSAVIHRAAPCYHLISLCNRGRMRCSTIRIAHPTIIITQVGSAHRNIILLIIEPL